MAQKTTPLFFKGNDGNVWVNGDDGLNRAGTWDNNTVDYWSSRGYALEPNENYSGSYNVSPPPMPPPPTSSTSTGTGSTGSTAPAYSQEDMDYLNNQMSLYDRMKQSLDSTQASGMTKLQDSETYARNNANDQQGRALRDYGTQREDSKGAKNNALGNVDTNARTLRDSVLRMLGMASGAGSSAYKFAAPNAVARDASRNRNNVMNSYGKNERDLDLAVEDTNVDFGKLMEEISRNRKEQEETFLSGITTNRQGIEQSQGEIAAEIARLQGGDALSASRPYQDRYLSLQGDLDAMPSKYRNEVSARDLQVKTPKLSDYLVDRQALNATRATGQTQYSPYSSFLRPKDEEELQVR